MIEIINKPLLLHLVGYLYYWQMGFNSVFKGLKVKNPKNFHYLLRDNLEEFNSHLLRRGSLKSRETSVPPL